MRRWAVLQIFEKSGIIVTNQKVDNGFLRTGETGLTQGVDPVLKGANPPFD
jgi:hypothetical protein